MAKNLSITLATDGTSTTFSCGDESSLGRLQLHIAKHMNVPVEQQILLAKSHGGTYNRLTDKRPLSNVDSVIHVYDRSVLDPKRSIAATELIFPVQPEDVHVPAHIAAGDFESKISTSSQGPLAAALREYEKEFALFALQAQALEEGTRSRCAAVTLRVQRIRAQGDSIHAAQLNLQTHTTGVHDRILDFSTDFWTLSKRANELLADTPGALQALSAVQLHPALQTDSKSSLADLIPAAEMKQWANRYEQFQRRLDAEVSDIQQSNTDLQRHVQETVEKRLNATILHISTESTGQAASSLPFDTAADPSAHPTMDESQPPLSFGLGLLKELDAVLQLGQSSVDRQQQSAARLRELTQRGLEDIQNALNPPSEPASDSNTSSSSALDVFRSAELLKQDINNTILADMYETDSNARCLQQRAYRIQIAVTEQALDILRSVVDLQSSIRALSSRMDTVLERWQRHQSGIADLAHIRPLPKSYEAYLHEVPRRHAFVEMYNAELERCRARLLRLRRQEIIKREQFVSRHGWHLPQSLLPPLLERPSRPVLQWPQVEQQLPDIKYSLDSTEVEDLPVGEGSVEQLHALRRQLAELKERLECMQRDAASRDAFAHIGTDCLNEVGNITIEHLRVCSRNLQGISGGQSVSGVRSYAAVVGEAPPASTDLSATVSVTGMAQTLSRQSAKVAGVLTGYERRLKEHEAALAVRAADRQRVSISDFSVGALMLFLPTPAGTEGVVDYVAFHVDAPYYFLSRSAVEESRRLLTTPANGSPSVGVAAAPIDPVCLLVQASDFIVHDLADTTPKPSTVTEESSWTEVRGTVLWSRLPRGVEAAT